MNMLTRFLFDPDEQNRGQQNRLAAAGRQGSAMDVYTGRADEGVASNGDIVRRLPNGSVERVSQRYGYAEAMPAQFSRDDPMPAFGAPSGVGGRARQFPAAPRGGGGEAPSDWWPEMAGQTRPREAPAQTAQASGVPRQGGSGRRGGFLEWLFDPDAGQRRDRAQWLESEGLDAGSAQVIASDDRQFNEYVLSRPQRHREQAALTANAQFLVDNGYDPREARIIAGNGPMFTNAMKDIQEGRKPKPGEGFTLGKDQTRYDAQGNVIAAAPRTEPNRPPTREELDAYGIPPEDTRPRVMTPDGPKLLDNSGVNVSVGGQEGAFAAETGKSIGERAFGVLDDMQRQAQRLNQYEQIASLLLRPGVYTGTGGETISSIKRMASTLFGIEGIEGVADAEAARRIGMELFAGFRQEMLSGATSDADRRFILGIPPNVGDSAEGIALIVEFQRKANDVIQQRAAILQDLIDQSQDGNLTLKDWNVYLRRSAELNAFDPADMERIRAVAKQNAQQSGPLAGLPLDLLPRDALDYALGGYMTREEVEAFIAAERASQNGAPSSPAPAPASPSYRPPGNFASPVAQSAPEPQTPPAAPYQPGVWANPGFRPPANFMAPTNEIPIDPSRMHERFFRR